MSPIIIYICFGREIDYYQTLYSVLSLIKYSDYCELKDHKVIIYTDAPEFFTKFINPISFNIEISRLTAEDLFLYKGGNTFQQVFRVKLALILQTLKTYQRSVLYLDADTYVLKDFSHEIMIDSKESGMCAREGLVRKKKNNNNDLKILQSYPQYFSRSNDLFMFNAGLILIHRDNTSLIQNALDQMDEIFPTFQYYFLEQLLVSYHLSTHTNIKTFESYIRHYWYQKEFTEKVKQYVQKLPHKIHDKKMIPEMSLDAVPAEKIYKSFIYQWPLKVRRKLRKWHLVK